MDAGALTEVVALISERPNFQPAWRHGIGQFPGLTPSKPEVATEPGRLIFHFFASLAQFERELIRERTMSGLAVARARGRLGGRKPKTTQQQQRSIRTLWSSRDHTRKELAAQFGVSIPTIDRIIRPKSLKAG